MKRSTMILNGSSAVIFQVALTAWMFCLSSINFDFEALGLSFLHICAVPLILYYINFFLLERTVPIPVYIVTQLAFLALGIFLFIKTTVIDPLVLRTMIINGIIYATAFITAAFVAWDPVHTTGLLLRFDFLAIMMILLLLLDNIRVLPAFSSTAAMCGSALVFTLLT